jgi:hypothetical protein
MRGKLGTNLLAAALIAASVGWLSWWRGGQGDISAKAGLSWVQICHKGGCMQVDFDAGKIPDVPWRVTLTRWAGWAAAVLVLLAGLSSSRELRGLYVLAAAAAVGLGAWTMFGSTLGGAKELAHWSWGYPVLLVGCLTGLGAVAGPTLDRS